MGNKKEKKDGHNSNKKRRERERCRQSAQVGEMAFQQRLELRERERLGRTG